LAATFKLPSRKRGWGCVTAFLHTPLSPLSRGESQKIEIPIHFNYAAFGSDPTLFCHSRINGNPDAQKRRLDFRFRGNDLLKTIYFRILKL